MPEQRFTHESDGGERVETIEDNIDVGRRHFRLAGSKLRPERPRDLADP